MTTVGTLDVVEPVIIGQWLCAVKPKPSRLIEKYSCLKVEYFLGYVVIAHAPEDIQCCIVVWQKIEAHFDPGFLIRELYSRLTTCRGL